MEWSRRRTVATALGALAFGGCSALQSNSELYDGTDRLYSCGYDATAAGLIDRGDSVDAAWHSRYFIGQTRDIMPDRDGNLLVCDNRGLHKFEQRGDGISRQWVYTGIDGSIRGITVDPDGDYYVGSWTANQGFHKVTETETGGVRSEWIYRWSDDTGMITGAAAPDGRLALALKNGEVHIIEDGDGQPVRRARFQSGTNAIMREVLWDGRGNLYVGSENHLLYKLRAPAETGPTVEWRYDAGNMIFGASVTPQGEIYVATNAGEIRALHEEDGEPQQDWIYQHTEHDQEPPTAEYFWEGKAHQVATHPDPERDGIYSCAYGENTVHRIGVVDGDPQRVWEYNGHSDNVREIRVHGEYVGAAPGLWAQYL